MRSRGGGKGEQWGIIFKPGFPVWLLRQGSFFYYSADGTCDGVQCHANATCFKASPEQRGSCVCQDGWQGNGTHCQGKFDIMICFPSLMLPIYKIDSDTFRQFFFQGDIYLLGNFTVFSIINGQVLTR